MRIPQWLSVSVLFGIIITVLFILPYCEKASAGPIVWDYSINDYRTLPDCPRAKLLDEEYKALAGLYPKPACPRSHMSVPSDKIIEWLDKEWEWVGSYEKYSHLKRGVFNDVPIYDTVIIIRKRICQEGK